MIQVDIGGHPPIPFGPARSILAAFQIQHDLLFLAGFRVLHSRSRFGALMIQVDIGGHPPIPVEPPPSGRSVFKLRYNLLFLAVFWVLNFRSCFEALNDIFWENGKQHWSMDQCCCSKFVVIGQIFLTMYGTRQTEIGCQSYVPGKLKHQFTQTRPTVLVLHLLGLGFWTFWILHCFSTINRPTSLIVTQFRGLGADTSLLRDKHYQCPSSSISIMYVL